MEDYKIKIKAFFFDRKKLLPILLAVNFIIIAVLGYNMNGLLKPYFSGSGVPAENAVNGERVEEKEKARRFLDGVMVDKGKENLLPMAVMIENHVDARPQSGLSRASLVYEAEAEGGITRFLAVFDPGENIEKIGPVRSARPYYIDWANELKALYIHCGGSPEALAKIINERINDLNEFYNAGNFWRDNLRAAPHNVYTSTEKLLNYLEREKIENERPGMATAWKFKEDTDAALRPKASKITVNYKGAPFTVLWSYDNINNEYSRFQGGLKHADTDGREIRAKNIIIQFVESRIIDEEGRRQVATVGSGKAKICLDGQCREGIWKKKDKKSRTAYFEADGREIEFNSGASWIEVVPIGYLVKIE